MSSKWAAIIKTEPVQNGARCWLNESVNPATQEKMGTWQLFAMSADKSIDPRMEAAMKATLLGEPVKVTRTGQQLYAKVHTPELLDHCMADMHARGITFAAPVSKKAEFELNVVRPFIRVEVDSMNHSMWKITGYTTSLDHCLSSEHIGAKVVPGDYDQRTHMVMGVDPTLGRLKEIRELCEHFGFLFETTIPIPPDAPQPAPNENNNPPPDAPIPPEALQPAPDQPLDAPIPPEAPQPAPNQNTDELSVAPDASDAPNLAPNAPDAPQTSTANPETEKRAGKRAAEPVTEMPVSKRSKPKRGESSSAPMK